jgi:hypothetical protein
LPNVHDTGKTEETGSVRIEEGRRFEGGADEGFGGLVGFGVFEKIEVRYRAVPEVQEVLLDSVPEAVGRFPNLSVSNLPAQTPDHRQTHLFK